MKRGDVRWADLPQPIGYRPVVLLSRNESYRVRTHVIITPVTTVIRNIASEVRLGPEDGLGRPSVANLDVIMTIPKSSLQRTITTLSQEKLVSVDAAVRFALGMNR